MVTIIITRTRLTRKTLICFEWPGRRSIKTILALLPWFGKFNLIRNQSSFRIYFIKWNSIIRIFQEHKEIKSKWIFATNLETEAEMLSNSQVRYHAKKIYGVISKILEKLMATTDVRQFDIDEFGLVKLGRSHYHYNVRREHFAVRHVFCFIICPFTHFNRIE